MHSGCIFEIMLYTNDEYDKVGIYSSDLMKERQEETKENSMGTKEISPLHKIYPIN